MLHVTLHTLFSLIPRLHHFSLGMRLSHTTGCSIGRPLTCSSCIPLGTDPPEGHHGAVVVDVQHSDLIVLLAENEEQSVEEFNYLGEVEEPYN